MIEALRARLLAAAPPSSAGFWARVSLLHWLSASEFRKNFWLERSAALAFATVISLIPLAVLFFSFGVLLGKGELVKQYAQEKILPFVAPDFQEQIMRWIQELFSTQAFAGGFGGTVGLVALLTLLAASMGVLSTAERNFNRLWKVKTSRSYFQKLLVLWIVLTTTPFLLVASAWIEGYLAPKGGLIDRLANQSVLISSIYGFIVPVTIGFLGFTSLFRLLPAASVRWLSAAVGGVEVAILWHLLRLSFSRYLANATVVKSFYGSLAIVPFFLIWIFLNWVVTLWGCQLAFAFQSLGQAPRLLARGARGPAAGNPLVGLHALVVIATEFRAGAPPLGLEALAGRLRTPALEVEPTLQTFEEAGVLLRTERATFVLGRAPESLRLSELLQLFRSGGFLGGALDLVGEPGEERGSPRSLDRELARAADAYLAALGQTTVADLLDQAGGGGSR